jgi:signal transduction histidine kinase
MPTQLLREPHALAHELRTPLTVLHGWLSLIQDGDVRPEHKERWQTAMSACQEAAERLNALITAACDEAEALRRAQQPSYDRYQQLAEASRRAIERSQEIKQMMDRIHHHA